MQLAILPDPRSNFWSRQTGAGGGGCTKRSNRRQSPEPQGHAPCLCNCAQPATCVFMPISIFKDSQCPPLGSPKHYQRMALRIPSDPRLLLARIPCNCPPTPSPHKGQCGKLTMLPLRASANTNTMTTAPNRSFSSSQVFRNADTGQAFAPSRRHPTPSPPSYPGVPLKSRLIT